MKQIKLYNKIKIVNGCFDCPCGNILVDCVVCHLLEPGKDVCYFEKILENCPLEDYQESHDDEEMPGKSFGVERVYG